MNGGKRLFIMRHAKSAWPDFEMPDFDRPLLPKGIADTKKIGQANTNDLSLLKIIMSSSAVRTMQTATILCDVLGLPLQQVVANNNLYLPLVTSILKVVKELPNNIGNAMIISHNPGLTDFVNEYLPKPLANMPTATLVCLHFNVERWASIRPDNLVDSWVDFPANH
ncbi:MAG: histidine phosphatase family protein [Tenuifilaceae bacterium]|nr:histidine phosphatase family protein [Tenuifilaceae bacterium]